MSPTQHAGTLAVAGSYPSLVQARREYGDRIYGDRHLQRDDMLDNIVQEAADCLVYLRLEQERWLARRSDLNRAFIRDLAVLQRVAAQLGRLCAHAADELGDVAREREDFAAVFARRWLFGQQHYQSRHLGRENLPEVLEEVADIQILVLLEIDRREKTGALLPSARTLLEAVNTQAERFATAVVALIQRTQAHPAAAAA